MPLNIVLYTQNKQIMDRRIALKQLAVLTGGLMVFPSCDFNPEKILAAYERLQINEEHKSLLSKVVETILPGGDIKGAKELNMQDFVLVMANDCLEDEKRERFTQGLKHFDAYVQKEFGKSFVKMEQAEAEEVFNQIVKAKENPGNKNEKEKESDSFQYFLDTTKRFTLQGYLNSEYFMTDIMPYNLIVGGFKGEKIINPSEKINTNG